MSTGSLLLNDIILTLYCGAIHFDRATYERLCAGLYDHYDTQSRTSSSYRFTNAGGGSCVVDTRHVRLTEFFAGSPPRSVVKTLYEVGQVVLDAFSSEGPEGFDLQMSARLPQKVVDSTSHINFLSSDEFIAARFMQDVDYSPLGGTPTGVGLRFLFKRDEANCDLRVEPYFKDRTYLFLDLGIQSSAAPHSLEGLREELFEHIAFFQQNVVAFIRPTDAAECPSRREPRD